MLFVFRLMSLRTRNFHFFNIFTLPVGLTVTAAFKPNTTITQIILVSGFVKNNSQSTQKGKHSIYTYFASIYRLMMWADRYSMLGQMWPLRNPWISPIWTVLTVVTCWFTHSEQAKNWVIQTILEHLTLCKKKLCAWFKPGVKKFRPYNKPP